MTIEKQRQRLGMIVLALLALMLMLCALGPPKNYGVNGDDKSSDVICATVRC